MITDEMVAAAKDAFARADGFDKAMRAALAAADRAAWRGMESAPRDGAWFMIIADDDIETLEVGCFSPSLYPNFVEISPGLFKKEFHNDPYPWRGFNNMHRATHWRPIPAPPEGDAG